jgi:hypothetical protein
MGIEQIRRLRHDRRTHDRRVDDVDSPGGLAVEMIIISHVQIALATAI